MATEPEEINQKQQVTGRQLALVIGGAVVLLALVWFFFLRGGGEEPTDDVAVPPPVTTPEPGPTGPGPDDDGDDDDKPPVETTEVFAPRDPFDPLLSTGGEGTDDGTDEGTDTDGDGDVDGDDGTGTDTDGDGDVDGDDTDDGTDTSEESVEGHRVQLISISGSGDDATAQIQVDDTVYTVSEGEAFAENFELLSTSGECATLLFGDDQFTVCEGEEILK